MLGNMPGTSTISACHWTVAPEVVRRTATPAAFLKWAVVVIVVAITAKVVAHLHRVG